jgi:sulfite exporter TauE/SafE
MDAYVIITLNGLALGLSSTLHCAGMCGAISCSLLLAQENGSRGSLRAAFALTHAGRVASYMLAGAVVGAIGAPAIGVLDRDVGFRLLQWAGAASLIWIGLSTAGLVPSIAVIDRGLTSIADAVARIHVAAQRRTLVPLLSGLAWGMMPCAMVYAALFTAMLTGSAAGGAVVMGAFGIGTLPGLIAASFGFRRLARVSQSRPQRIAAGLALAAFGVATVLIVHPHAAYLCLPERVTGVRDKAATGALDRHQSAPRTAQLGFVPTHKTDRP